LQRQEESTLKSPAILAILVLALGLWGCGGGDDDGTPVDPVTPEEEAAANQLATDAITDLIADMEEAMPDGPDPGAIQDMDVQPYLDTIDDALALDPNCANAHFLAAFLEFIAMAQDSELQAWLADAANELGDVMGGLPMSPLPPTSLLRGGLMGRSFEIMHRAPLALVPSAREIRLASTDKVAIPLVRTLQTIIRNRTLPATDGIVAHLTAVESHADWQVTIIDEGDTTELDLGEVYVLDACVRALRSGLQVATAYDVEPAPDGDYAWLSAILPIPGYTSYEIRPGTAAGDTLVLVDDEELDVERREVFFNGFEDLLTPGSSFLKLWTNPWSGATAMQTSYAEMNLLLSRLETAYDFIQNEDDDQSDDIISQMLIAELDDAIAEAGADIPDWIGTWETIPDVITWVEDIMSGPYTIPVDLGGEETYNLEVDISALFLTPVPDWKTKLPYHEFLSRAEWATFTEDYVDGPSGSYDPEATYNFTVAGEDLDFTDIGFVLYTGSRWDMTAPLIFLDGPSGNEIEAGEFPYFPDYTFGGLFPDMNRSGWLTLMGDVPVN
jgi:hypothetical protein